MAELRINTKWMASAQGEPEVAATTALLDIQVDAVCLTRNQDVWAETVRDNVFVSAYPLAMWFASAWWRLNHEPLPPQQPSLEWRMAISAIIPLIHDLILTVGLYALFQFEVTPPTGVL